MSSAKNFIPTKLCSILTAKTTATASLKPFTITADTFRHRSAPTNPNYAAFID